MHHHRNNVLLMSALSATLSVPACAADTLEPITVSADLRNAEMQDLAASVVVQTQADLQDQGATHFDDLLLKIPNVNFSGQSSRARYLQIRGLGERDEYTGAPNSSIGFALDGIDFSGIGMAANLFDVKQVEVLRGPQNVRYGQSAIGGLINIQGNEPSAEAQGMVEATRGGDQLTELGLVHSGPIARDNTSALYRISLFSHQSDGFRDNRTLNRTDTNGRDELSAKAKLRLFPDAQSQVDLTLLHSTLDNNYDAWSRENTYTTRSDNPGKDSQKSNALALKVTSEHLPNAIFTSSTALSKSNMEYSYDMNWIETVGDYGDYQNLKERYAATQELRWVSRTPLLGHTDWALGLYGSHLDETNQNYVATDYRLNKLATFGQLDYHLNPKTTVSASLRLEHQSSDFDNGSARFSPNETLLGASLSYAYRYNLRHSAYTSVTRGFKAGGFNADLANTEQVRFERETLYNYEVGLKSNFAELGLKTEWTLFYMDRNQPQFDGYTVVNGLYTFYTENFAAAQNYGFEGRFDWALSANWNLYGALGLIQTEVEGSDSQAYVIAGREQAHAPNYQANFGAKYRHHQGFYAQADLTALDSFYFDNVHNQQSDAYQLLNARIGYETANYEIYLWGRNLTDERYATRGYFFDHYDGDGEQKYLRLGDPRQLGVTARLYF